MFCGIGVYTHFLTFFQEDTIIFHLNFNAPFSASILRRRSLKTQLSFYRQASVPSTLIRKKTELFQNVLQTLTWMVNILKTKLFRNDDVTIVM